jgi:peptidoglycan hydrolase-like protein with peptidoglycan-binding domain
MFRATDGARCTSTTNLVYCPAGQLFNATNGERCNAVSNPSAPGASGYNFGNATLKNGSTGEAVKELQRFLNAKLNLGLAIDGKLGPKTIAVVKKWQLDNGLVADGLIGAKTKAKMNAE